MTTTFMRRRRASRHRGAVLVVGLIFLVLLTLIGVTAFNVATQEERMASNARDRMVAFEAAERALRDCEQYLGTPLPPRVSANGTIDPGMYEVPIPANPTDPLLPEVWTQLNWNTASPTGGANNTARQITVPGTAGVAKCIVELVAPVTRQRASIRAELPIQQDTAYQVTARGLGINVNTQVFLQSFYIRN